MLAITRPAASAVVIHHPVLRSFDIVELAGLCCPDKDEPGSESDEEHEYDESGNGPEHSINLSYRIAASRWIVYYLLNHVILSAIFEARIRVKRNEPASLYYLNLNEFITTVTELIAMAAAATIGLRTPAMASGIAAPL